MVYRSVLQAGSINPARGPGTMETHVPRPDAPPQPADRSAFDPGARRLPGPGPALPGSGHRGRLPARAAHHAFHPALGLGRGAQLATPAGLAGEPHGLRPHDPRLAAWRRGQPQGQVDVQRFHGRLGRLAAVEQPPALGGLGGDRLHGQRRGLAVAKAGTAHRRDLR